MNRREMVKMIGSSGIALTAGVAGCSQAEPEIKKTATSTTEPDTTSTEAPTQPKQSVKKEEQEVNRVIGIAPGQDYLVEHDSWSDEFQEVDGKEAFVVSITTRNPSDPGTKPLEYFYRFSFYHEEDRDGEQTEIEVTIPRDSNGLEPGESHEWKLVFDKNPKQLRKYVVAVQPG